MQHIISLAHIEMTTMTELDTTTREEDMTQVVAAHVVAVAVATIVQNIMQHIISLAHIEMTTMTELDTTTREEDMTQVVAAHVVAVAVATIVRTLAVSYGA